MALKEPGWWYDRPPESWQAGALQPVAWLYGRMAQRRFQNVKPYRSRLPVICLGNFTVGGTGKTPLALLIAKKLKDSGMHPVFLSRGYGGREKGPLQVEPSNHAANRVGDEPLLLCQEAPTIIARNRADGAKFIENNMPSADVIIMDDGMQNPSLAKDLVLAVVDRKRGLGNGHVFPAGPLRAESDFQFALADAVIVTGSRSDETSTPDAMEFLQQDFPGPVLRATTRPAGQFAALKGKNVLAFAAIANPSRFFRMLEDAGANVVVAKAFADHQMLQESEARSLLRRAEQERLTLVTTAKDAARLSAQRGTLARLKNQSAVFEIEMDIKEPDQERLNALLSGALKASRER